MITGRSRFNIYLLFLFAAFLACGCGSTKKDKNEPLSTLRIHIEVTGAPTDFSINVPIYRAKPVMITVDKEPFLTELNVASAKVLDVMGGFAVQIEFDHSGNLLLEEYTAANPGRHIAIFSLFGKKKEESRWLGAPIIARRISNGVLIFTPDASREESERIATGLNNYHKKSQAKSKW
jgi:preprotein translocase subunit SecD